MNARSFRSVGELVEAVVTGAVKGAAFTDYARVAPHVAVWIRDAVGIDVVGYVHSVDDSAVRHVLKEHGDDRSERARGQRAVRPGDFALLPNVVFNPERVTPGGKSRLGVDTIVFERRLGDAVYVVEEVRTGRKKLSLLTMWIKKDNRAPRANPETGRVAHTSETFPVHPSLSSTTREEWEFQDRLVRLVGLYRRAVLGGVIEHDAEIADAFEALGRLIWEQHAAFGGTLVRSMLMYPPPHRRNGKGGRDPYSKAQWEDQVVSYQFRLPVRDALDALGRSVQLILEKRNPAYRRLSFHPDLGHDARSIVKLINLSHEVFLAGRILSPLEVWQYATDDLKLWDRIVNRWRYLTWLERHPELVDTATPSEQVLQLLRPWNGEAIGLAEFILKWMHDVPFARTREESQREGIPLFFDVWKGEASISDVKAAREKQKARREEDGRVRSEKNWERFKELYAWMQEYVRAGYTFHPGVMTRKLREAGLPWVLEKGEVGKGRDRASGYWLSPRNGIRISAPVSGPDGIKSLFYKMGFLMRFGKDLFLKEGIKAVFDAENEARNALARGDDLEPLMGVGDAAPVVIPGPEGTEARITKIAQGPNKGRYSVTLWDTDAGKAVSTAFILPSLDLAKSKARQILPPVPDDEPAGRPTQTVVELPLSEIHVDPARFQPRGGAFSEDSARNVAEHFDRRKLDPLRVWRDPKDGRVYVLAGHSRREGLRRRSEKTAPVIFFEGTEKEAIRFAQTENDSGTSLTNAERAGHLRRLRLDDGLNKTELREEARRLYKRDGATVLALSFLNPRGKAMQTLRQFSAGNTTSEARDAETMASWIGKLRMADERLTDSHETELFDFLLANYKTRGRRFSSYGAFAEHVGQVIERRTTFGELADRLNFENVTPKPRQEQQIDEAIRAAEKEVETARKALEKKRAELVARNVSVEQMDRVLKPLSDAVTVAQRDLLRVQEEAGRARHAVRQSEVSLFDRLNPSGLLVFLGYAERLTTTAGTFEGSAPMFATADGHTLFIVPRHRVRKVAKVPADLAATRLFEQWSHYDADGAGFEIDFPDGPVRPVGTAYRIWYRSDKMIEPGDRGQVHGYVHRFDDFERPVRRIDDVLVVENLQIDARGILN